MGVENIASFSLDYKRLESMQLISKGYVIDRFQDKNINLRYSINFYDYVLNKINYNFGVDNVENFYKAKIFLESLNKKSYSLNVKEILPAFKMFQIEFSDLFLKLGRTSIKDVILTLPSIYNVPTIDIQDLEQSKNKICFISTSILSQPFDFADLYREFFRSSELEEYSLINLDNTDSILFKKAYWLRWFHNRGYCVLFDYREVKRI